MHSNPSARGRLRRKGLGLAAVLAWTAGQGAAFAQDLEPRRWTHLPVGTSVAGLTYAYSEGSTGFDPVLEILPYQTARWEGLLSGVPTTVRREGLADPWLRLSVDVAGAPALKGKEYQAYRAAHPVNTIVGLALGVMLPLGQYEADKLLNLGQNRFVIRPQTGVLQTRGPWSYELTGSVFVFTRNDDFFGGNEREQDPLFALRAHVVPTFSNRWWASLGTGHSWGGESSINGVAKDERRGSLLAGASVGLPIGETQGLKLSYLRGDTLEPVGSDTDSLLLSWSLRF